MAFLERNANRGSVSTGYDIDNSVKLQTAGVNSEFFNKSYSSTGNRETWTFSTWVKRTEIGSNNYLLDAYKNSNTWFILGFSDVDDIVLYDIIAGTDYGKRTTAVYRDTSAWYHIVFVSDTTNGTAGDRQRLYVNGVRVTDFDSDYGDPPSGYDGSVNDAIVHSIGYRTDGNSSFNGYLAETILVDGTALDPTDFGEFDSNSGIWKPIEITDTSFTWGTNGLWLKYDNAASMGANSAGTGGFSVQNVNQNDQATDTPTNNFCIGNALVNFAPGGQTLVRGATKFSNPSGQNWQTITGTFGLTSGKWYWEFETDGTGAFVGISDVEDSIVPQRTDGYFLGYGDDNSATTKSLGMYSTNGVIYNDSGSATGTSYGSGNRVGVALDMDNRKIYFAVDNNWANSGDPANGTNGATWNTSWSDTVFPAGSCAQNNSIFFVYGGFSSLSNISNVDANGYGGFYYTPPSGFYALCTKNLAEYG
tara:strand:- start:27 stop:1454 length:1428 start_codon:yes stop_codon:yes gene_type:complete